MFGRLLGGWAEPGEMFPASYVPAEVIQGRRWRKPATLQLYLIKESECIYAQPAVFRCPYDKVQVCHGVLTTRISRSMLTTGGKTLPKLLQLYPKSLSFSLSLVGFGGEHGYLVVSHFVHHFWR